MSSRVRRGALALAVAALLSAGCLDAPKPARRRPGDELEANGSVLACLRQWPERCRANDADCQREVFATVRCLTGAPPSVESTAVRIVAAASFASELKHLTRAPDGREPLRRTALALLGLTSPNVAEEVQNRPSAPAGFYSYATREIVLPDEGSDTVVLAHEYVHALQDREGRIGQAALSWTTLDEDLARRATLEGEAVCVEQLLRARYADQPLAACRETSGRRLGSARCRSALGAAALASAQGCFVYAHGAAFVALHEQPGSLLPTDFHLAEARGFTRVLMAENLGFEALAESPSRGPSQLGSAHLVHGDRVGAWLSQRLIAGVADLPEATDLDAREYLGDWLGVYAATNFDGAAPSDVTSVLWRILWASEVSALRAEQLLSHLPAPDGGTRTVHRAGAVTELTVTAGSTSRCATRTEP